MTFGPRVKIALLAATISLFLVGVLLVVLPTVLVNRPQMKSAIQVYLSSTLGGEIGFEQVKLTLFPCICATVAHPRLDMPGKLSARAVEFDLCLKLLPLLRGRVMADSITLHSPEIHLPIAPINTVDGAPGLPDPRRLLQRMADLLKQIPETAIEVTDGRVELTELGGPLFEFHNLNLRFNPSDDGLEWSLQGESGIAKAFSSRGRLKTDSLAGTITLQVTDFRPQLLQAFFLPDTSLQVLDTRVDLDVSVALEGPDRATSRIAGKAPVLALGYNRQETRLNVDRFDVRLELSEKRLAVSVPEFSSLTPRVSFGLTFVVDDTAHPKIDIGLKGRGDLSGARDFALAMLHEIPEALLVCDILRSGDVPQIQVNLHGDSWDELAEPNNLRIKGRLENGRVYLPWIDLDLNEVFGDALISGGVLQGRGLKAHYKGTHGENGALRVGLSSADPVLQLDIFARAELAPLPPLLARVVPDPVFRREVARIQEFSGTAQGMLRLKGTHTDVRVAVQASDLDVKARHQDIPYPFGFQGGGFVYDGDRVDLTGVDVAIGDSKLFKHNIRIGLQGDMPVETSSPKAIIDLAELFNLFHKRPPFNHLRSLEGVATFHDWQLDGQVLAPATWRLKSNGTIQNLSMESELLPELARQMPSGSFDWTDRIIRYESLKASIGRSEVKGLAVEVDWAGPTRMRIRTQGMDAAVDDLSGVMRIFPILYAQVETLSPLSGKLRLQNASAQIRALSEGLVLDELQTALEHSEITSEKIGLPLRLTSGSLAWNGSKLDMQVSNASWGKSTVQNLWAGADWNAGGVLELRADTVFLECGELIPRMVSMSGFLQGMREDVKDIQGAVILKNSNFIGPLRDFRRWRMRAESELQDIVITTTFLDDPIEIPMGRLTATDGETAESSIAVIRIDSARVRSGSDSALAAGDITFYATETSIELNISADSIDWNKIEKISDQIAERRMSKSRAVRGRLRVRAESLAFDRFRLYPFHADAQLAPERTEILIERAGFCGMPFIGRLTFDGPMVDAYLVPVVDVMRLDGVASCLSDEKSLYSGNFSLNGELSFRARREDITSALNGSLAFVAEDGTIKQSFFFARLFALLNLTEIYRGQLPDFKSEGLDYKRMTAAIEVKDGKIMVPSWSIDGRTLWMGARGEIDIATGNIDFTIMVSPFKTVDRIINSIPGIRWILGGRLVAIPVKAVGTLKDPDIIPLSPSAVGVSIMEMIERMLTLPIQIIQPLVPGMEETEGSTIRK